MSEHISEAGHHVAEAGHHAGAGIKGTLGKRLGPMPLGGWLLAVGAGIGVAVYFRNRSAGSAANLPTDPATDPGATGTGDFTTNGGMFQADPGSTYAGVGNIPQTPTPTPTGTGAHHGQSEAAKARHATTNAAWEEHAVLAMKSLGFAPAHTRAALDAALHGHRLTQGEEVTWTATVSRCGPPPHPPAHIAGPGSGHDTDHHTPPAHHHVKDTGTPNPHVHVVPTPPTKPIHPPVIHLPAPRKPHHPHGK